MGLGDWLDLPVLATHGALLGVGGLGVDPLEDTVLVEGMRTDAPEDGTVVARLAAVGAAGVEGVPADPARVVARVPRPGRHQAHAPQLDLHTSGLR